MNFNRNADAFGKLAGICAGLEGRYNPAHPNLLHPALVTQLAGVRASIESVNNAERTLRRTQVERSRFFLGLTYKASRLRDCLLQEPALSDARLPLLRLVKSYRPVHAKAAGETEKSAKPTRSAGTGFAGRIAALERVVAVLRQYPSLDLPAPELTTEAMANALAQARALNDAVSAAESALAAAREERNRLFLTPDTGAVDIARKVRSRIRAQFGRSSAEARALRGLALKVR